VGGDGGEVDDRGHESAGQNPRMRSKTRQTTHIRRRERKTGNGGVAKEQEALGGQEGRWMAVVTNQPVRTRKSPPTCVTRCINNERSANKWVVRRQGSDRAGGTREGGMGGGWS
jgi:hypothetical protein